jgi:hypothetical protein
MALLSKAEILAADDRKTVTVDVPEWGGTVEIAVMPGWARDEYEGMLVARGTKKGLPANLRARYVSYCVVDEKGDLMFTMADLEALGKKSSVALDRIFEAASILNGTSPDGMDEVAKN